ncbi:uncharacterized protein [Nicotiana tomentosiformis]|uniref:uncharacterized protein isoform X2 n=1 Tax=Nicotiana tomentosiformis TaxID=4098 RepID=UPI00051BCEB6|nr:UDP-N-acetylglucosamine transferase subunit ALG13 homolog isoform X2 [Nicotiana tomentosiformis]
MGETGGTVKEKKVVFVTVGTTCFDALVRAVDTPELKNELFRKGYTNILIQIGRGSYIPTKVPAGSGSIFETLRLGKPLIVVVNEDLMDNHQSELAEELAERKHLFCARPQTLYQTIADMDTGSLIPYQPGDAEPVAKLINRYLGFPDD